MYASRYPSARGVRLALVAGGLLVAATACQLGSSPEREVPLPPDTDPEQIIDADNPAESITPLRPETLADAGKLIQADRQRRMKEKEEALRAQGVQVVPPKTYNLLLCSGGGIYGAYSAGVLCGWTDSGLPPGQGGRPDFDVVTGISTGAIIAPLAFLGSEFDWALRREYTTVSNDDIYVRRRSFRQIFAESLADNTPLRGRVAYYITPENMARLAAEHEKGRRLYIGTTNIDTKRITLWDIGAIAARGTPEAMALIIDVIMASTAIPAFFAPVEIHVSIDGVTYQELHIDGGVTRSLFFRPPHFDASQRKSIDPDTLAGSNLYMLVASKIDPTPSAVRRRTLRLAREASTVLLYSLTRGDLYRMYTYCLLTGMNYRMAAIPDRLDVPSNPTEFDPVSMTKMFCAGYDLGKIGDITRHVPRETSTGGSVDLVESREGTAWRDVPPGLKSSEKQGARSGTRLTVRPRPEGDSSEHDGSEIRPSVPSIR